MGVDQELLPIGHADLVENVGEMMTDCAFSKTQPIGDLFVRKSLTNQLGHLSFALGQCIGPHSWLCF